MEKRWIVVVFVLFVSLSSVFLASVASAAPDDYEIRQCKKQDPADPCLNGLAMARQDPAICPLIDSLSSRNGCFSRLARKLNDKTLCLQIRKTASGFGDRYDCYKDFITGPDDLPFCLQDLAGDEDSMDRCVLKVSAKSTDPVLCDSLYLEKNQMACLSGMARKTNDLSLCDAIGKKVDIKKCKAEKAGGCTEYAQIDLAASTCRHDVEIGARKDFCTKQPGHIDLKLASDAPQTMHFRGDDPSVNTFTLTYDEASNETMTVVFTLNVQGKDRRITLQPGITGSNKFVNTYLLEIYPPADERTPPVLDLCVWPSAHDAKAPAPKEEPVQEPPAPEPAKTKKTAPAVKKTSPKVAPPAAILPPSVSEKEGGSIFSRIISFIKKFF